MRADTADAERARPTSVQQGTRGTAGAIGGAVIQRRRRRPWGWGAYGGAVALAVCLVGVLATTGPDAASATRSGHTARARTKVAGHSGDAVELVSVSPPERVHPTQAEATDVSAGEQALAIGLLQQLSHSTSSSNVVVSPSSLAAALAMLELGARGTTESQIAHVLGTPTLSPTLQAAGWSRLDAAFRTTSKHGATVQVANSLWQQQGFALVQAFMRNLETYFNTGIWETDFARHPSAAAHAINGWVTEQTHGHIPALFGARTITATVLLVLVDAAYFKATWKDPFTAKSESRPFTTASGSQENVPFLVPTGNGPVTIPVSTTATVAAAELPYDGGRFSAFVVMPKATTLAHFDQTLTPQALTALVKGLVTRSVLLSMPSLDLTSRHTLKTLLQNLGMHDAFTTAADLIGISSSPLAVQQVVQQATLQVTASGTTASAATGVVTVTAAAVPTPVQPLKITIDRPYLFFVRDTATGTILFEAAVTDP